MKTPTVFTSEKSDFMKKHIRRLTALLAAFSSVAVILPENYSVSAEEQYFVRDPFYNYDSGYNYYESEHFQFIWGNSGDSSKVTSEFIAGNVKNLEACWNVYMNDLDMTAPSQSVNLSLRDGKNYKTNIYISGTGLSGMEDDWAYMAYDSDGYAYMFCCVDSMKYEPPSWVLPHEFGHVVTAHQLGWNDNKYSYAWWEAMGNWFREQYLYSDYSNDDTGHGTDFFETYLKNSCLTFPCGRDYYSAWAFLQYLTENPDNLSGYGSDFVKKMLQEGQVDEYPLDIVERLAKADIKDTLGNYAKHIAALDFKNGDAYRARLNELLSQGSWNWQQIYTMLEPVAGEKNTYQVPTERAPQHAGLNIVPLNVTGSTITVTLNGLTNINGADWRACIVQYLSDGSCKYSELFSDGDTCSVPTEANLSKAYLSVIATPDSNTYTKIGLPFPDFEFSEENHSFSEKQRYPYSVKIDGAEIMERTVSTDSNWWETYHNHSNGGGLVSDSASVDDSVYVASDAKILGSAKVTGNVKILDHAIVQDNVSISDNAVIGGYAIIAENAVISGNARVDDYAVVCGRANVSGNAKVIESACVYDDYTIKDNACAKGLAFCMAKGSISGQGVVDGDYYDDSNKTAEQGVSYGWVSSQNYVNSRPYTDKLMYAYDFKSNSSLSFNDRYTSTYGSTSGNPVWEEKRTSANGVLTLDGNGDYAQLDRGLLYTENLDLQLSFISRSSKNGEILLYLGNDSSYIKVLASNSDGCPEIIFKDSEKTEKLTSSKILELGTWTTMRIILDGDMGKLVLNGETVATGTITINPNDIANHISLADSDAAYRLGADNKGNNEFNGSVDFVRVYSEEAESPTEIYTEHETITANKTIVGDIDFSGNIDVFDLVFLKHQLILGTETDARTFAAADINGDGQISVADAVLLQQYLLAIIDKFPTGIYADYEI